VAVRGVDGAKGIITGSFSNAEKADASEFLLNVCFWKMMVVRRLSPIHFRLLKRAI